MIFKKLREACEASEAALDALSKLTVSVSYLEAKVEDFDVRLRRVEEVFNDDENQKLRAERDYINGMYNMLNYDIGVAKKPKGKERK